MDQEADEKDMEEAILRSSGFCKDDIYTKYLAAEYKKLNKRKNFKSTRSQKQHDTRREAESLHYATEILRGPIPAHYGGLPVIMNRKVQFWVNYYKTKGRHSFLKWLIRGENLRGIIQPILREEGIPEELFYLAMIESGFNNRAYSRASATGTWQFMSATAKAYDLSIGHWVDERKDPAKSTRAAARYLKQLYTRFGDWYLAIAAYNAGPGKINRAIRKTKSKDFWEIADSKYLKAETKNYIPKILAAITVASELQRHGFQYQTDPKEFLPTDYTYVKRPLKISEIAVKLNIKTSTLKNWNPELIQSITPPERIWKDKKGYKLRLASNLIDKFHEIEPQLSQVEIKDIKLYKIRKGDTLFAIARRHNISVNKIRSFNPNMSARALRVGRNIAIPIPAVITTRNKG